MSSPEPVPVSPALPPDAPDEPLRESAPLMYRFAMQRCAQSNNGWPRCDYYHGAWQFLRALGLVKKAGGHSTFLLGSLADAAATGQYPRVLIAGAADYSLAAHVYSAYRGFELDLTLVDRCPTPLEITRWYADRENAGLELVQCDLLAHRPGAAHDLIVTSSLLGNFAPDARPALFRALGAMLRPGGKLITTSQVDRDSGLFWSFSDDQAEALATRARARALETSEQYGFDPDVVESLAREYGLSRRIYRTPTAAELQEDLTSAGFYLERFDLVHEPGGSPDPVTGPSMDEARKDALVVASRI
jgi:hypothetical protein